MINHFMGDWIAVAVAARVFGPDMWMLLRRIALAGVRLGNAELAEKRRSERREVWP
ncbi:hypothetical protein [Streptomyces lavendulocolor]|uniref:hypothetical protein n=1 Tax=Streptomyces lavendulocolor TaxID=67316 RepID=UPI00340218E9